MKELFKVVFVELIGGLNQFIKAHGKNNETAEIIIVRSCGYKLTAIATHPPLLTNGKYFHAKGVMSIGIMPFEIVLVKNVCSSSTIKINPCPGSYDHVQPLAVSPH
jgi:hypothetical protein